MDLAYVWSPARFGVRLHSCDYEYTRTYPALQDIDERSRKLNEEFEQMAAHDRGIGLYIVSVSG